MFNATTCPKSGEIRLGYVCADQSSTHKYIGIRPYLIVSNDVYNQYSGQSECIPFTTKRFRSSSPAHVDFSIGEVSGLNKNSTLAIEARDTIRNSNLSDPIGFFTQANWDKVVPAMLAQNPCLKDYFASCAQQVAQ